MSPKPPIIVAPEVESFLLPYLPTATSKRTPYVTLTYATSLDSHLSLRPGVQTVLSGSESKAMTHYLRSKHAAILVGVSTAVADDPGLNCRIEGSSEQPTPIVLDPRFRWQFNRDARVLRTARDGKGKAPLILVSRSSRRADDPRIRWVEEAGGAVVGLDDPHNGRWEWTYLLEQIAKLGLGSLMIEGGAGVINTLLAGEGKELVDAVVITIAPVYLGAGGVNVSPPSSDKCAPVVKFQDVGWHAFGQDVVMAGRMG